MCQNCKAECAGTFCSQACAEERYSIVMELIDAAADRAIIIRTQVDALAVEVTRLARLFR